MLFILFLFKNKNRCLLEDHRKLPHLSLIHPRGGRKKDVWGTSVSLHFRIRGAKVPSRCPIAACTSGTWATPRQDMRSVGPQRAIPSIIWADAVVIQLHDCGRNVCPRWGQDGFRMVHKCLWARRPCGKLNQVRGVCPKTRHLRAHCTKLGYCINEKFP